MEMNEHISQLDKYARQSKSKSNCNTPKIPDQSKSKSCSSITLTPNSHHSNETYGDVVAMAESLHDQNCCGKCNVPCIKIIHTHIHL